MPDQTAPGLGLTAGPGPGERVLKPGSGWPAPAWTGGNRAAGGIAKRLVRRLIRPGALALCLAATTLAAVAVGHNVSKTPTDEDVLFIRRMLAEHGHRHLPPLRAASFEEEIDQILQVQDAVLRTAPVNAGIPLGAGREPRDLYEARRGLCYDRSRSIEKALALLGMETRHVAVYSLTGERTPLEALLAPATPSHALTEVRTRSGWMLVDSNDRWIGLRTDGRTVSADDLAELAPGEAVWSARAKAPPSPIFRDGFLHIYGLYSRHGRFYPPMDGIPDVNLTELAQNLL